LKPTPPLINALANIVTGFSIVIFQIIGTRIVASTGADNLGVWALAVSLAGFAPLFAFNLNTGVARLAIGLLHQSTHELVNLLFCAARLARRYLGIAVVAMLVGGLLLPIMYPVQIGVEPVPRAVGVAGLFIGSCWIVFAQPLQGVLIARQQNISIAKAMLLGRLLALAVLWAAVVLTDSLPWALVACGVSLWFSYWLMRRDVPEWRQQAAISYGGEQEAMLGKISRGFALWSITALLFQVSLVPLVGVIEPESTTPVYLAVTLLAILVGVVNAGTGALIAPIGRMVGEEAFANVVRLSWLVGVGLVVYSVLLILALPQILELWVGNTVDVAQVQSYLMLIAGLQCVRLSGAVSSVTLMVKADNRQLTGPSLFELAGLLVLAVPLGLIAGVPAMLAALMAVSCIATCATVLMAARLNDVPARDKRVTGLLCLPVGFAAAFVVTGFLLS